MRQYAEPQVVERVCGGWLATSAVSDSVKIGVTAESEDSVKSKFAAARDACEQTVLAQIC